MYPPQKGLVVMTQWAKKLFLKGKCTEKKKILFLHVKLLALIFYAREKLELFLTAMCNMLALKVSKKIRRVHVSHNGKNIIWKCNICRL